MTGLRLHWPSIRGRARADAGPLLLVAGVITAVVLLAGATPPLIRSTSDDATRDAVRRASDDAAVQVEAEWPDDYGPTGGRLRAPQLAADVADVAGRADGELDPGLRTALRPPVSAVSSISLMITDGSVQRRLQLEYLSDSTGEPDVTWVAGRAPGPSSTDEFLEIPLNGAPWPVQVGLSEADAKALGAKPGDRIPVQDERRNPYDVRVTGVFRPTDANDPVWDQAPWVLDPVANRDGFGSTRIGALLTADSLPDARLAFRSDQLRRVVRFDADPATLTWESAQALAASVAGLKGGSAVSAERDLSLKWSTQLDSVLRDLREQVATATAQASVLLIGVLTVALLVIALAADLLTRRRATALTTARRRGAALPGLATELAVESVAVGVPAAVLGLALAFAFTGSASLTWVAPFVVIALAAGPAFGTLAAARATRDRRAPANRSARRWIRRTGLIRRVTLDASLVALAAASLVALHQRGIGSTTDLPAAAPTLCALALTLLVMRLLPLGTGLWLRLSLRSRRPLALFGAARAAATASRLLPALTLTTALALGSFAVTLYTTTDRGLTEGAWEATGADARLTLTSDSTRGAAEVAARTAAAPGVRHAVAAQVSDNTHFIVDNVSVPVRLVVVDIAAFRQLLADTPLPELPSAVPLTATGQGPVPALVRTADGSLAPGMQFRLPVVTNQAVALTAVGAAPAPGRRRRRGHHRRRDRHGRRAAGRGEHHLGHRSRRGRGGPGRGHRRTGRRPERSARGTPIGPADRRPGPPRPALGGDPAGPRPARLRTGRGGQCARTLGDPGPAAHPGPAPAGHPARRRGRTDAPGPGRGDLRSAAGRPARMARARPPGVAPADRAGRRSGGRHALVDTRGRHRGGPGAHRGGRRDRGGSRPPTTTAQRDPPRRRPLTRRTPQAWPRRDSQTASTVNSAACSGVSSAGGSPASISTDPGRVTSPCASHGGGASCVVRGGEPSTSGLTT